MATTSADLFKGLLYYVCSFLLSFNSSQELYKVAHCSKASQRHPIRDLFSCLSVYICFLVHDGLVLLESHFVLVLEFNISLLCYSVIILFSLMVTFVSLGHAAGVFSSSWVIQTGIRMRGKLHRASTETFVCQMQSTPALRLDGSPPHRTCKNLKGPADRNGKISPEPGEQTCASKPTKLFSHDR